MLLFVTMESVFVVLNPCTCFCYIILSNKTFKKAITIEYNKR